jgi:hypothetical protein
MMLSVGSKDLWAVGHHNAGTRASGEIVMRKGGKEVKDHVIVTASRMVLALSDDLSTPYLI